MQATPADIQKLLSDMRYGLDNRVFIPICRKKNLDTLAQLGLTWDDAKDEIYGLTVSDYVSGPDIDRDYPSSDKFWKFKKVVSNCLIYIKLKVEYQINGDVRVVSFHIDGK